MTLGKRSMTPDEQEAPRVGRLLRQWREGRRISQLELSHQAGVSARHLSFLETGRAKPSREMVLRLADELEIPLRERNRLLLAAGYAPTFGETPLAAPPMTAVRQAIRQVLDGHNPYPALVVDAGWNVVEANASFGIFTEGVDPELLRPPVNVLRLALHPRGMAPRIANLGQWRAHVLNRMRRRVAADTSLGDLYSELSGYPCEQVEPELDQPGAHEIFVPLHLRRGPVTLAFFAMFSVFGAARDITVSELIIESFFPADTQTAAALRNGLPLVGSGRQN